VLFSLGGEALASKYKNIKKKKADKQMRTKEVLEIILLIVKIFSHFF
jgi:hypothetical protein